MDIETLQTFFMWCTIINAAVLVLWITMCMLAPDLVYRSQGRWFPIPREAFNVVMFSFIGIYKIFFLMFNLIPYVALLIVG